MSAPVEEGRERRPRSRWLRLSLPLVLLLAAGVSGIREAVRGEAETLGQRFVIACELGYGVLSFLVLYGLLASRRWARPAMLLWGVLVTAAAAVATIAFGDAGLPAAIVGGVGAAGLCAFAIWLAFPAVEPRSDGRAAPSPNEEIE